jgi:hypothetical protein
MGTRTVELVELESAVVDEGGSAGAFGWVRWDRIGVVYASDVRHSVASESCRPNTEIPTEKPTSSRSASFSIFPTALVESHPQIMNFMIRLGWTPNEVHSSPLYSSSVVEELKASAFSSYRIIMMS